jgi:hypothetical protein
MVNERGGGLALAPQVKGHKNLTKWISPEQP